MQIPLRHMYARTDRLPIYCNRLTRQKKFYFSDLVLQFEDYCIIDSFGRKFLNVFPINCTSLTKTEEVLMLVKRLF